MRIGTPFVETVISKDGTRIGWAHSGDGPPGVRDLLRQDTGAPCRIRTCDLVLRRHPLWSTELRGRGTADYKDGSDEARCLVSPRAEASGRLTVLSPSSFHKGLLGRSTSPGCRCP